MSRVFGHDSRFLGRVDELNDAVTEDGASSRPQERTRGGYIYRKKCVERPLFYIQHTRKRSRLLDNPIIRYKGLLGL